MARTRCLLRSDFKRGLKPINRRQAIWGIAARDLLLKRAFLGAIKAPVFMIPRTSDARGYSRSLRDGFPSIGISLSVFSMRTGVLDFTHTPVSLKCLVGTFSSASPTVFEGNKRPFFVVLNS